MTRPPLAPLVALAVAVASLTVTAIDVIPPYRTVAERVADGVDAVLHVRAISEPVVRGEDLRIGNPELQSLSSDPLLTPIVEQDVLVLEVIKGRSFAVAGSTIRVGTSGGHDSMNLASDWRRRRAMATGGTYVLFVAKHPISGELRYWHWDMFRVDPPRVIAPNDETAYAQVLIQMTPAEALAYIRQSVQRTQR